MEYFPVFGPENTPYLETFRTVNEINSLLGLIEAATDFALCWKYADIFQMDTYRNCLKNGNSVKILKDTAESLVYLTALNKQNHMHSK